MLFHFCICAAPGRQRPSMLHPVVPIGGPGLPGHVIADRGGDKLQLLTLRREEQMPEFSRLVEEARGFLLVTRSSVNHRSMEKESRIVRALDKRLFEMR